MERGGLPLFVVTCRNRFDADRNQSTGAVSGAAVIKIERDKQEVEVKLNNGMELTLIEVII